MRFGLRPLRQLRAEVADIREGRAKRLDAEGRPTEARPLVSELNRLLDANAAGLERARRSAGNLAHGLKAPLATLAVTLAEPERDPDGVLAPLVGGMNRQIRQHRARAAVDRFEAETGPIDILVNNAGMQFRAPLEEFPADAFERLLQTNIASIFHMGQACARHMIGRGRGKIINIASVQTALTRPSIASYTATKGAVGNLTKGMATDWARRGLQCNAIAPGYFDTPLNVALVADPDFSAWIEKRTPAGRWGRVEELVGACVFLASDASSFVNGHILYVDGGITASL